MQRYILTVIFLSGLVGTTAAGDYGWFLETPRTSDRAGVGAELLKPRVESASQDILNLRAGYRFSEVFTLHAGLDEYLLDTTRGQSCLAADFVCRAASDRSIHYGTSYALSLAPAIRLDDDLSIYGHLGVQGWNVQPGTEAATTKHDLLFGIGVGYDVSNPFRVQLEYRSMDLDIKLTSIGFTWRF